MTVVEGDVTRRIELRESITAIVHCAADTRFSVPLDQARAVNVAGTANVLAFARRCPRLEKLMHLSTAYVAGRPTGRLRAEHVPATFSNAYQQSKHESEALVVDAMGELPASIFRLSTIIGDAETGRVRQFNYVHRLLRLLPKNLLLCVPGDPAAPIDLIPGEWAIDMLAARFGSFEPGHIHQGARVRGRA